MAAEKQKQELPLKKEAKTVRATGTTSPQEGYDARFTPEPSLKYDHIIPLPRCLYRFAVCTVL